MNTTPDGKPPFPPELQNPMKKYSLLELLKSYIMFKEKLAKYLGVTIYEAENMCYILDGCGFTEDQMIAIMQIVLSVKSK